MICKVSGRTHSKAAKLSDKWGPPHCQTHHSNTIAYTRSSRAVGSGSIRGRGARSLEPAHGIPAELRNQPPLLSSIHYANRIRNTNLPSRSESSPTRLGLRCKASHCLPPFPPRKRRLRENCQQHQYIRCSEFPPSERRRQDRPDLGSLPAPTNPRCLRLRLRRCHRVLLR